MDDKVEDDGNENDAVMAPIGSVKKTTAGFSALLSSTLIFVLERRNITSCFYSLHLRPDLQTNTSH